MDEAARVQLDADPEWAESYLGPEPDFTHRGAHVWSFYWMVRNGTPSDSPLDLERALSLHSRLHGGTSEVRLAAMLQAMDIAFLTERSEHMKRKSKEAKGR